MGLISKRPKLLLYAQNSPKDSIGQFLGTLPARRFGRVHCWEAIGDARCEFREQLKGKILDYLEKNNDKVQDSGSIIDFSLFMLGRSPVQAKPTVMFVSENKKARKEAFDMIKDSDILEDYPGFELGHLPFTAEFENLRFLAGRDASSVCDASSIEEPLDVFSPRKSKLVGQRLYFYSTSDSEGTPQMATAGGGITYRGRRMLLTVDHFLEPSQTIAKPSFIPGLDEDEDSDDECEITGLSEFDDEDEDQLAEITSQGSITPEFEASDLSGYESNNDRTSIFSSGSSITVQNNIVTLHERLERLEENQASILPNGPSNEHYIRVGKAILRSKELDYSLVEIDPDLMNLDDIRTNTIDLKDVSQIERDCRDAAVKTTTPDGGIVGGTLSGTPSYVRLPHSKTFVEVYIARFNRPLVPGDCGSWVRDAITGCLFGHVFAGSPTSGLTMIMPACHVFEDARHSLESQHGSETRSSRDILGRVDPVGKDMHQNQVPQCHPLSSQITLCEGSHCRYHLRDHLYDYLPECIQMRPLTIKVGCWEGEDLAQYFHRTKPPRNMIEIAGGWKAFVKHMKQLHYGRGLSGATSKPARIKQHFMRQHFLGAEGPVNPVYDVRLSITDLGFTHTMALMNDGDMSAVDSYGDQTFGAPETSHYHAPKSMLQCQFKVKALPRFSQKRELKNIPDGHRHPPVGNTEPPKIFGCPFYMTDQTRYHECSNLRLRRVSDVSGHIARCHLLQEKTLVKGRDAIQQVCPEATVPSYFTCREYLESKRIRDSTDSLLFSVRQQYAGTLMACICPTVLCEPGLATSATTSPRQDNLILTRYPTRYWPGHFRDGVEGPLANAQVLRLFKSKQGLFENCVTIWNVDDYRGKAPRWVEIYYASLLKLDSIVPRLLSDSNVSALPLTRDRYYESGLQQASAGGCGKDGKGRTPLSRAAEGGHEAIVRLLLARGAHTEAADHEGLVLHEAVVRLLFDQGAYTKAANRKGRASLSYATEKGHEAVVRLLLDRGAHIEAEDKEGKTPLFYPHNGLVPILGGIRQRRLTLLILRLGTGAPVEEPPHDGLVLPHGGMLQVHIAQPSSTTLP